MVKIGGNPVVGDIAFSTTEQEVQFDYACDKIILCSDAVCQVSINDNAHYKNYNADKIIPIKCIAGITKLYVKSIGTGTLGVWGYVR